MRAWPLVVLAACHVPAPPRSAPSPPPALDDAAARAARLGGEPERVVASLGPRAAQLDVDGLVELGRAEAAAGHPADAARVLRDAVQRAEAAAGQRGAWRWLDTPRDMVVRVAVSPDLGVVATADRSGWIRAWDLGSGTERWVAHAGWPNGLVISPDGRWLAAAGGNGPLWVWNLATGDKILEKDTVRAPLAFAPDGALIAGRNERDDGLVRVVLPAGTATPIAGTSEFADNLAVTRTLVISTDEPSPKRTEEIIVRTLDGAERARFLAAAFTWDAQASDAGDIAVQLDGRIQLFDARGALRHELPGGRFVLGRDGRRIVVEDHGALAVYDVASGARLRSFAIGAGGALALHGDLAVVAGPDGIATWNIDTGQQTAQLGHATGAEAVAFDPSGAHLAVGNASGEASVWDLATGALATIVPRAGLPVTSLAFDGSGALAIGSRPGDVALLGYEGGPPRTSDSIAGVWDLATRAPRWTRDTDQLAWLAFRPRTGELAADAMLSTGNAGSVGVELIARDGGAARTLAAGTQAFAWTPDGQALVEQLGSNDGSIGIVPLDGGAPVALAHEASVAAFAPDGATLAFGDSKGRVSLWDVAAAAPRLVFIDDDGPIADLAWSPDGAIVATAAGHSVRLWDRRGARLATFAAGAPIAAIAYRPDGRLLAAARVDGPVELWAIATGTRVATLVAPGGGRGLVLGPDGAVDGELHDDDPLAWQVGARALPARGAWAPAPGLLARLLARVPAEAAPRPGLPGAAPPAAPPACYTPAPGEQREIVDPHADGDGLALCVQPVRYSSEPHASPPPACFRVDLTTGAWTPRAPTPRQILGDAEPATGAATVRVDGDRASVCRGRACTTVLLPAGISQPERDVQIDDAGTLLGAQTDRAILTYDVATGRRRARIPLRRSDGTDVAIALLGHAVMVTTTPCAGPCSSSALYDGATGRLVASVGGGMDTSYTTPGHVAGDVRAFNDGNATVIYQNVRTGRVLAKTQLPAETCGPDDCDPTRLVHAGTGVVAVGGAGALHVLDRGGTLAGTYTIPTCAPR